MKLFCGIIGFFFIIASCSKSPQNKSTYVNPTGTYKYDKSVKTDGVQGYPGVIQVQSIREDKIVLNLSVQKGPPSYNSGGAFDTLAYQNNVAIYRTPEFDPSCKITFSFSKKGVIVEEKTDDYNSGCGFGHAVVAGGFFRKTSSRKPVFMNFSTGRKMEF